MSYQELPEEQERRRIEKEKEEKTTKEK